MKRDVMDVLAQADPMAGVSDRELTVRLFERRRTHRPGGDAELSRDPVPAVNGSITRTHRVPVPAATRGRRPRRRIILVAAAVVTAVVGGVGLAAVGPFGSDGVAVAAMPVVLDAELAPGRPARAELLALAARAAANTTLPGDGSTHSVRTSEWNLSTRVDGRRVDSAVVPEEVALTWNADRPGRLVVRVGEPFFPSDVYREAWKRAGSPAKPGEVIRDEEVPAGGFTTGFTYPLPTQPAALLAAIKVAHQVDEDGTSAVVTGVTDLAKQTLPSPATRAAILRVLANRADVRSLGVLRDRAGRSGQAFGVDSASTGLPQRTVLIFDSRTGALLMSEDVLTRDAGALRVPVPSVISYTLFYPGQR